MAGKAKRKIKTKNHLFIKGAREHNLKNISDFIDDLDIEGLILSGGDNLGEHPIRDSTEKSLLE